MAVEFSEPVVVYTAENNSEAVLVEHHLKSQGIAAYAVADQSVVTESMMGPMAGIHKPQVWVDRPDAEQALELLRAYEAARRPEKPEFEPGFLDSTIDVICEACDTRLAFTAELKGSVQNCDNCSEFVDVGEVEWDEVDYMEGADEE